MVDNLNEFINEVERLKQTMESPGHIVFWSVSTEVRFSRVALGDIARNTTPPIDDFLLPQPVGIKKAWHRAVANFNMMDQTLQLKKIFDCKQGEVAHALIKSKELTESNDIKYEKQNCFKILLNTGEKSFEDPESPVVDVFMKLYEDAYDYLDHKDLQLLCRTTIEYLNGFAIRPSGGCYFVPLDSSGLLGSLTHVVKQLDPGCNSTVVCIPIFRSKQSTNAIRDTYIYEARKNLATFIVKLKKWIKAPGNRTIVGLENKLQEIRNMRNQAVLYEPILEADLLTIREACSQLDCLLRSSAQEFIEPLKEREVTAQEIEKAMDSFL